MRDDLSTIPRWARALALSGVALALSVFAWWPVLKALPNTQAGDGPPYHKTLEAARISIVRYKEFPHWNPYECGGLPLWDNPQAPLGAPLVWPMFVVGTTTMMAWWYVIHSALGFGCMWLFARRELSLSRAAAFVASAAWAFAGFHQQHYSGGHFTFVPFLYFPLGILLWRRAVDDMRFAVGLGVLVAWMMYEGGVYPIPHLAVILAVETLLRVRPKNAGAIVRAGAVVVAVGITLGASRFLPVFEQLKSHTRPIGPETDALQWETFKSMFLARTHDRFVAGQGYVWPEYGAYLGPIVLALAFLGILLAGVEHVWLMVLLAFSVALMFGHAGKYAPWAFLKAHVFPFKEMRVPSRFRCEVTMFLAVFAGLGVDRIVFRLRALRPRFELLDAVRTTVVCVALIGVGDVISVGLNVFEGSFTSAPEQTVAVSPRLYIAADTVPMIDQPRQNLSRLLCWDEWGFGSGAPLWLDDVPQAKSSGATVANVRRTPNTFTFDVAASAPARVLLNGTYDKGWRSNVGVTHEENKQLVLDVPAGTHHVVVRYLPRTFRVGAAITIVSLLSVIGYFIYRARRGYAERRNVVS